MGIFIRNTNLDNYYRYKAEKVPDTAILVGIGLGHINLIEYKKFLNGIFGFW